ncbi:MAG: hypothetical protein ACO3I4_03340 [Candidatus Kapaibacteriota bacterium]|jgi:hypothetical protein
MDVASPWVGAVTAIAICAVNTALGYVVTKRAFGKELNAFLAVVFGSMAVRGIAVVTAAWYCLSIARMHQVVFSLTFAVVCFVMLMGEILFFHRSYELSKRQVRRPVSDLLKKNARLTSDRIAGTVASA